MPPTGPPIVCDLSVLTDRERQRIEGLARARFAEADVLRALPDGYRIGFGDASTELITDLAEFLALDRLCCPFLRHALVSEPGDTGIWLELTGPHGAAAAIAEDNSVSFPTTFGPLTAVRTRYPAAAVAPAGDARHAPRRPRRGTIP